MKKILYIESSPRKDRSHSINVTNKYIEKIKESGDVEIKKIAPNLPVQPGSILERQTSKADPSEMKKLGWNPKWTVQKFLDKHGFEVKL